MNKLKKSSLQLLKIDIEGYEWGALEVAITDGSLDHVDQLLLEFHFYKANHFAYYMKILDELSKQGFYLFYYHTNPTPFVLRFYGFNVACCYEIGLIKIKSQ